MRVFWGEVGGVLGVHQFHKSGLINGLSLSFLNDHLPSLELTVVEAEGREVRAVSGDGFNCFLVNFLSVNQVENLHFQSNLRDHQVYLV